MFIVALAMSQQFRISARKTICNFSILGPKVRFRRARFTCIPLVYLCPTRDNASITIHERAHELKICTEKSRGKSQRKRALILDKTKKREEDRSLSLPPSHRERLLRIRDSPRRSRSTRRLVGARTSDSRRRTVRQTPRVGERAAHLPGVKIAIVGRGGNVAAWHIALSALRKSGAYLTARNRYLCAVVVVGDVGDGESR